MDPDLVMITWVCNYTYIIFIQIKIHISILSCWGFPGGTVAKNLPADAGDARDVTSSQGQEDPLEQEMATHSGIFTWETSWTEEPGRLQSMESQKHSTAGNTSCLSL